MLLVFLFKMAKNAKGEKKKCTCVPVFAVIIIIIIFIVGLLQNDDLTFSL